MVNLDKYPFIINDIIYDCETYPNCFTLAYVYADGSREGVFEISDRKVELQELLSFFRMCKNENKRLVGFNNLGFDSCVIHWIIGRAKKAKQDGKKLSLSSSTIYKYAMKVIDSHRGDGFCISVRDSDVVIKQLDLFKINHYDNKAKMTSLKLLEFNMRLDSIEDLPFPVGKKLTHSEIQTLVEYNFSDIYATKKFYEFCLDAILFREDLTVKYGFDCTNLNDSKIGEQFFMKRIESENPYAFYEPDVNGKKKMKQTKRDSIVIKDCLFDYVRFKTPQCKALHNWFKRQVISETKGVFSDIEEHLLYDLAQYSEMTTKRVKFKSKLDQDEIDNFLMEHPLGWVEEVELKATEILKDKSGDNITEEFVDEKGRVKKRNVKVPKKSYYGCYRISETLNITIGGMRIDFGVGGLHGAVSGHHKSNDDEIIKTVDVASMYPNIAIANRVYPEHLSESFCNSYEDFYNERKKYPKGTGENLAIKLGLNATYGNSNNAYSPFYDPKYTMSITINGQLTLLMLIERLVEEFGVKLLMGNTDGIEFLINKDLDKECDSQINRWEKYVGLIMEGDYYSDMYIADVNNYYAITVGGDKKQKGRYEYKPQLSMDLTHMHKNHSALIVQMAAENWILNGGDCSEFIRNHKEPLDFMLRTKVPRSSKLVLDVNGLDIEQQNICRYYVSIDGGYLVKIMPPLVEGGEDRRLSIESGLKVKTCNNINDFSWDVDYDYYIDQANKLLELFV